MKVYMDKDGVLRKATEILLLATEEDLEEIKRRAGTGDELAKLLLKNVCEEPEIEECDDPDEYDDFEDYDEYLDFLD